tara:strand:+ start:3830 stop:4507 length:678 start_codon:yes stop_codon:yes gene_type:complete
MSSKQSACIGSAVGLACLLLASCQGVADDALGDGPVGEGLVAVSEPAPAGAKVWSRPTWHVGDTFTMVRGEHMRGTFAVQAIKDGTYVVDMGNGRLVHRDQDLGNLGEWRAETGEAQRVMSPVDVRYHWPLWVGKSWQCEFVDRVRDGQPVTMSASYEVEGLDRVEVIAGAFDALRIRRTLRLVGAGAKFLTRTQMIWFAPDPGIEVRQLLGDTMVELASYEPAK